MTGPPLHGGDLHAAAARWGLPAERFVDFSANINPLGPPAGALAAAAAALAGVAHYPEPFARTLRAALARRHQLPEAAIIVTGGASEALYLLLREAAGRRVALPVPGFAEYGRAARAAGATVLPVPFDQTDPPAGLRAGDWWVLCNPHNPTGHLLRPGRILALAGETPATLLVDEAFIDLTEAGEEGSVIPQVLHRRNLVVLRSLTKFYALPGLRVGYAAAPSHLAARLDGARDPWSVSAVAQAAALAALADSDYAARTRAWIAAERPFLARAVAALPGWSLCEPPSANFLLARAPVPAHRLQERLGPLGILIRDCRSFEGLTPHHVRLAVRTRAENLRLLAALPC
ncbi:MAG: threonine-phosphate decarboxylase CobD [Bacillota bacterium]